MTLKVLSVAGFDGSGGAGITSDTKIFSKFKILGLSAISVITAQNPDVIYSMEPVSNAFFTSQLRAVFDYFAVDAVKTGLIFNEDQSSILSGFLNKYKPKVVVVDPVYISTSDKLLVDGANYPDFFIPLFKHATAITPNIREAELIAGINIEDLNGTEKAAKIIRRRFPEIKNIIIKGSHIPDKSDENIIFDIALNSKNEFFKCESKRLKVDKEIHGTGCAFSACIASMLAKGAKIEDALVETEKFVSKIIRGLKKIPDNSPEKKVFITGNI